MPKKSQKKRKAKTAYTFAEYLDEFAPEQRKRTSDIESPTETGRMLAREVFKTIRREISK